MNIDQIIDFALKEDIGDGDHTSLACIPIFHRGRAKLIVKEKGVIAGIEIAKKVFHKIDKDLYFNQILKDGEIVKEGDIAFTVEGSSISILSGERLALNFMQRMSGIATKTRKMVDSIKGLSSIILDTRKTTPNFRLLEKMAVELGGAKNHRFGLYDMIMIKDNHVDFAGGIENAINNVKNYLKSKGKALKIEIEVRNFDELQKVLSVGGVDRIMLDNFTPENLKKAISIIDGRFETEASGGITETNLKIYAETGVNYISIGSLTHNIKSLDLSLKAF